MAIEWSGFTWVQDTLCNGKRLVVHSWRTVAPKRYTLIPESMDGVVPCRSDLLLMATYSAPSTLFSLLPPPTRRDLRTERVPGGHHLHANRTAFPSAWQTVGPSAYRTGTRTDFETAAGHRGLSAVPACLPRHSPSAGIDHGRWPTDLFGTGQSLRDVPMRFFFRDV